MITMDHKRGRRYEERKRVKRYLLILELPLSVIHVDPITHNLEMLFFCLLQTGYQLVVFFLKLIVSLTITKGIIGRN